MLNENQLQRLCEHMYSGPRIYNQILPNIITVELKELDILINEVLKRQCSMDTLKKENAALRGKIDKLHIANDHLAKQRDEWKDKQSPDVDKHMIQTN